MFSQEVDHLDTIMKETTSSNSFILLIAVVASSTIIWLDITSFDTDTFSVISLVYQLRNESDLGGKVAALLAVAVHTSLVYVIIQNLRQGRLNYYGIFSLLAVALLHIPFFTFLAKY